MKQSCVSHSVTVKICIKPVLCCKKCFYFLLLTKLHRHHQSITDGAMFFVAFWCLQQTNKFTSWGSHWLSRNPNFNGFTKLVECCEMSQVFRTSSPYCLNSFSLFLWKIHLFRPLNKEISAKMITFPKWIIYFLSQRRAMCRRSYAGVWQICQPNRLVL